MTPFFVAGTDTGVGKTWVSCAILRSAQQALIPCLGLKPVAAGAEQLPSGLWVNQDALDIQACATVQLPYRLVNPLCFEQAVSPNIAASRAGCDINFEELVDGVRTALTYASGLGLVEGAGGWRVPISDHYTMADLAKALGLPVVLVVGLRLGCINHALLTCDAVLSDGLAVVGWIANEMDESMAAVEENVESLCARLPVPLLARVKYGERELDISKLLEHLEG